MSVLFALLILAFLFISSDALSPYSVKIIFTVSLEPLFFCLHFEEVVPASLVAQWLRIHLPMQGTRVRALVWEGPTCRGATKPVHHNY